jgi:hypothetical protein
VNGVSVTTTAVYSFAVGPGVRTAITKRPVAAPSGSGRSDIRSGEIITGEEQWLVMHAREGVGETVAEVKSRWVPAAAPKVAIRIAGHLHLVGRDGHDCELSGTNEVIEATTRDGVAAPVNDDR